MVQKFCSPNGKNCFEFDLNETGQFIYSLTHDNDTVINPSSFQFEFIGQEPLEDGFELISVINEIIDEQYELPWGENRIVQNQGSEHRIVLKETQDPGRDIHVIIRVYDDGIAWRYHFPENESMDSVLIAEERTQFRLTGDHKCWWIPGDWDIYEHLYNTTTFSKIDALTKRDHPNLAQTYIPVNAVNTPVTMKTDKGLYLSFHEANLTDYAGMTLQIDQENLTMVSNLVGGPAAHKVFRMLPFNTPWRTIQISENPGGLIESNLILNLNEPNKLGAVPWFTPMKYVGIWWEMHLGKSSWDGTQANHGATTENAKRYIDFAAKNNIGGVLVEGWNTGWSRWIGFDDREGVFDFITPYPDYDLEGVAQYAKDKGVQMIMHHETSAAPRTYEKQLDTAFALMQRLGMHTVKTGYVGPLIPKGQYHHGQWMVNHYRKVLETAAKYEVAINAHEPIKATGIRRTYPNAISREGLRGQEFNAWSVEGGNPPEHLSIVAFTRMLAGPIDFTPGIFHISLDPWKKESQINTTLAHQLALYVVIYSPVQMAADLVEHYEKNSEAFQFIRDVGVDWEESKVLDGQIGEYVVIVREERESGNIFIGGITNDLARNFSLNFNFLDPSKTYKAKLYTDGEGAHFKNNPTTVSINEMEITSNSKTDIYMAPGGGFAISLMVEE